MGEYMGNLTTSIHAIDFSTMRRSLRQLAAVKPSRFLEAGSPTGLTGLFTHNAPRSTLLYLYSSTLEKLMAIVSAVEPEGYKAWAEKARQTIKEHPEVFNTAEGSVAHDEGRHVKEVIGGAQFVTSKPE